MASPGNFFRTHTLLVSLPEITTTAITGITDVAATSGGNVLIDGGATVTDRGVCWNTTGSPTTADSHTHNSSGTGSFTSSLTSLSANTLYHVRAYAVNSVGTAYGNEQDFTTAAPAGTLATVINIYVSTITENSATAYSSVTSDGGNAVTARGVCWGTSINPTIAGSLTSNGTGTGTYYSYPSSLTYCTTYWLRAYATNGNGTAYSDNVSFNTTRPSGLTNDYVYYAMYRGTSEPGTYVDFRISYDEAVHAWTDWRYPTDAYVARVYKTCQRDASYTVGSRIYSGHSSESMQCGNIGTGYYLFFGATIANDLIVYLISGVINTVWTPA